VEDSINDDLPDLQQIHDDNPTIHGWTDAEANLPDYPMSTVLTDGVLPPNGSKELFQMQSIKLKLTDQLIGMIGVYQGFPDVDILWINILAFHTLYQNKGFGKEVMDGLSGIVKNTGAFTRMRTSVNLKNLPSLRLCLKAGFDKIILMDNDPRYPEEDGATSFILEKSLFG